MKYRRAAVIAYTDKAMALGEKASVFFRLSGFQAEVIDGRKTKVSLEMERLFSKCEAILFVSAAGIAVRMIAPHIKAKDKDPAVIVMDEGGNFVISLLSGHLGGANEIATAIGSAFGAEPVITTATDVSGRFAVDVWTKKAGCVIENVGAIKYISAAVLKGEKVCFHSDFDVKGRLPEELTEEPVGDTGISVSLWGKEKPFKETLNAVPRVVSVGAGCRRDTDPARFKEFILKNLEDSRISVKALESISSIELKKDETCMKEFAHEFDIPFITYTAEELNGAGREDSAGYAFGSSDFVKKTVGTDNVCEKSAFLSSGRGRIILKKTGHDGMTVSIALRDWKCEF